MQTVTLEVGAEPKVKILSIGGDLRLSGREGQQLEAKAPRGAELVAEEVGEGVEIRCRSDCLVYLPRGARIEGESVGGDTRATDLSGELMLRTVGGDLSLRSTASCSFKQVGGDLLARSLNGNLNIDRIGGDAIVDRISGDALLLAVGGDLSLRRVDGSVQSAVGGDASLGFTTLGGRHVQVSAGGDLACRLPEDASASIKLSVAGDRNVQLPASTEQPQDENAISLGAGEVEVSLQAGGDLWLRVGQQGTQFVAPDLGSEIAAQVEQEIELGVAEMEARLGALGAGMPVFDSRRIGERVRKAVSKARRQADQARRQADKARQQAERSRMRGPQGGAPGPSITIGRSGMGARPRTSVSDEERLTILRMLESGTITVDEAEKLLQALEEGE